MIYELKHFDTPLIRFSLENEGLRGNICQILWHDEEKSNLLPISLRRTDDGLLSWLRSRSIPKNRGNIEAILASLGLSEHDLIGILNICLGLSLNDCYWVVTDGFQGKFTDFNLYDNDFSKTLSLIAYTGYGSMKKKGFTSSPEFTTNGMLRKGWRRLGGKTLLYKGGTEGASNAGNEPYSEYYASQIADVMEIDHVSYTLSKWKKSLCSVCELFTSKERSFIPMGYFGNFRDILELSDYLKYLGKHYYEAFVDMMIFDAVIYNTDRHYGNFGLLINSKTNQPVAMAPVFNNGLGLFPYAVQEDLDTIRTYAKTRSSAFDVSFDDIAKEFITDRQREGLRKLLNFDFTRDKNYNLSAQRLKILEKFIRNRAAELLKF